MTGRDLHPGAWWMWALGLAAAASRTTNPWLLLLIIAVAAFTVSARRSSAPWALSFRLYLILGAVVVLLRVVFRIIFGGGAGSNVVADLPAVPLPDWVAGITLLGPLTSEALADAAYDGLRLAAILICIGAANSLANPKRLLAGLPPALYEVGTAIVIAMSLFPQLAESVQRVRRARALRGDPPGTFRALLRVIVPVLEDALDRSLALAASMDARGYGRNQQSSTRQRHLTGALLIGALLALAVGAYGFLDTSVPRFLGLPMLLVGALGAVVGLRAAGSRVQRTRYRPDPWLGADIATATVGVAVGLASTIAAQHEPLIWTPSTGGFPGVSMTMLAVGLLGAAPAVFTPRPRSEAAPHAHSEALEVAGPSPQTSGGAR